MIKLQKYPFNQFFLMSSLVPLYLIVDINQTSNVKIITLFQAPMGKPILTNTEIPLRYFDGTTSVAKSAEELTLSDKLSL